MLGHKINVSIQGAKGGLGADICVLGADILVLVATASNETLVSDTAADALLSRGFPRMHYFPANQVSSAAARNHPTTRAGGQDDVSSQANSLKLRHVKIV